MILCNWVRARIRKLYQRALRYNVNPKIFLGLCLFSFLPYYFGIAMMVKGSGIFSLGFREVMRFRITTIEFNSPLIIGGFILNRLAWALPYLYIEIWGKGLRWYIHFLIWVWVVGSLAYILWQILK